MGVCGFWKAASQGPSSADSFKERVLSIGQLESQVCLDNTWRDPGGLEMGMRADWEAVDVGRMWGGWPSLLADASSLKCFTRDEAQLGHEVGLLPLCNAL